MANVIALIRTSTAVQEVESQKQEVINYIKRDGYTDANIIVVGGAGASAIKVDDAYKKNLQRVYDLIEQGNICAVYAYMIDRIGRNEVVLFQFKDFLVKHGVQLVIANPSLRLLNEDGSVNSGVEIAFSLFATMAKQEMEQKKKRFTRGKNRNREAGIFNGGKVRFGYTLDADNRFQIDPDNAAIVEQIFGMIDSGLSVRQVANELNARGLTNNGRKWQRLAVYNIVNKGEIYTGEMAVKCPVIIPTTTYNRVRQKLSENITKAEKNRAKYLCSRLIICHECGHPYVNNHGVYNCMSHALAWDETREDYKCENTLSVKVETMDFAALAIAKTCEMVRFVEKSEDVKEELLEQMDVNSRKIATLHAELSKSAEKKMRIADAWIENVISKEEKDKRLARLKEKEHEAQSEIKRLEALNKQLQQSIDKDNKIHLGALKTLSVNDYDMAREVIKRHIEKIEILPYNKQRVIRIHTYSMGTQEFLYNPKARTTPKLQYMAADKLKPLQIDGQNVPLLFA